MESHTPVEGGRLNPQRVLYLEHLRAPLGIRGATEEEECDLIFLKSCVVS